MNTTAEQQADDDAPPLKVWFHTGLIMLCLAIAVIVLWSTDYDVWALLL